jgi:hypothetical protein
MLRHVSTTMIGQFAPLRKRKKVSEPLPDNACRQPMPQRVEQQPGRAGRASRHLPGATNLSPADFPLGSPESRAVARSLVEQITRPSPEDKRREELWALIGERVASFDAGCLLWLTQHTATEDNHWMAKGTPPVAPFPKKQYFAVILKYILESPRIFIPKSREMMTSWLVC